MIIHTYLCRQCEHEWDVVDRVEPVQCVKCAGYKTQWVPKGGHPLKQLRRNDAIMRSLADSYGLTNMKSAREGECMAPNPAPLKPLDGPGYQGIPGMNIPLHSDQRGNMAMSCQVITPPPEALKMGDPLANTGPAAPRPKLPSMAEKTNIAARCDGEGRERSA